MFSLAQRILFYFAAAPDEELTTADLVAKTGRAQSAVTDAVKALRDDGTLQARRVPGQRHEVLSLTPEAHAVMLAPLANRDAAGETFEK